MSVSVLDISRDKKEARHRAFAARKAVKDADANATACAHLSNYLRSTNAQTIAAYMAIQTEIDPMPTMIDLHEAGRTVCVPVIQGHGMPLIFRRWTPDAAMIEGDFGAMIPRGGDQVTPDLVVVPLVGFDMFGHRIGYGGGFYDRTLELFRKTGPFSAIGFAFSGQEMTDIPTEKYDQPINAIVTERGVTHFE